MTWKDILPFAFMVIVFGAIGFMNHFFEYFEARKKAKKKALKKARKKAQLSHF